MVDSLLSDDGHSFKRTEPLGFIGSDYQRFLIHFASVVKRNRLSYEYVIRGKTRVKANICEFQGSIIIKEATLRTNQDFPEVKLGSIRGEYTFNEDRKAPGSGFFKGKFILDWYFSTDNTLRYDALYSGTDGFSNNEFIGSWTSYRTKKTKPCNWGDYRIPESGDLDIGAGEFGVNPVYESHGWQDYHSTWETSPDAAKWWE